ncbi:MAG: NADH-quinone oxidoreductase subunit J [Dehalococcoidia bacterium]|nr:NADH-quinone oxidoreductase subunit J [Dehalococcoidia bacterium]
MAGAVGLEAQEGAPARQEGAGGRGQGGGAHVSLSLALFAVLAAVCLGGGLGVVTSSNVAYAALFLLVSLLAVAGVYVLLLAEFLALVQVLIYGGAVIIVLLFALMLTRIQEFDHVTDNPQKPLAVLAAATLLGVLAVALVRGGPRGNTLQNVDLERLGTALFSSWVIPFEIVGVLLLVVLLGVVIITQARGER